MVGRFGDTSSNKYTYYTAFTHIRGHKIPRTNEKLWEKKPAKLLVEPMKLLFFATIDGQTYTHSHSHTSNTQREKKVFQRIHSSFTHANTLTRWKHTQAACKTLAFLYLSHFITCRIFHVVHSFRAIAVRMRLHFNNFVLMYVLCRLDSSAFFFSIRSLQFSCAIFTQHF